MTIDRELSQATMDGLVVVVVAAMVEVAETAEEAAVAAAVAVAAAEAEVAAAEVAAAVVAEADMHYQCKNNASSKIANNLIYMSRLYRNKNQKRTKFKYLF